MALKNNDKAAAEFEKFESLRPLQYSYGGKLIEVRYDENEQVMYSKDPQTGRIKKTAVDSKAFWENVSKNNTADPMHDAANPMVRENVSNGSKAPQNGNTAEADQSGASMAKPAPVEAPAKDAASDASDGAEQPSDAQGKTPYDESSEQRPPHSKKKVFILLVILLVVGTVVTGSMLSDVEIVEIDGGKAALLDVFKNIPEYDGIYTITAFASDYAGNIVQSDMVFSVNRFGSVYLYDPATADLMNTSRRIITNNLLISEFNPSAIVSGSSRVYITRDGVPISDPIFEVSVVTETGEPGAWCQYDYVISKENFLEESTYEIVLSTQDIAGNFPENTADEYVLRFSVDHTPPQLPSILGLEKAIHNGSAAEVVLTATDNVSVQSITVFVNDAVFAQWDGLSGYSVEQVFEIPEGMNQTIRIVVVDEAGNSLDTNDESFLPGYEFHSTITVSANFFLRFYANKPLFYGSIAALILLGLIWIIFLVKEEKQEQEEEKHAIAAASGDKGATDGSEPKSSPESIE